MRRWLLLAAFAFCGTSLAQSYPTKPVRFIVSFPPGGSSDLIARAIAPHMSSRLGQPVVVENRPGAGGMIGVDAVAKAAPDGYTIGLAAAGALSSNISLYPSMPFHPEKDLAPISTLAMIPFFLIAHPSQPATLKEVIARARSAPGALSFGHGGSGSTMHLSGELLNMLAGVKIQAVPYKGSGPVSADVLGGQVPLGVVDVPSAIAHVRAGKLRALAVTSKQRISAAPEVPTFEEAGVPGYEAIGWFGTVAPAATPRPIVNRLNAEIRAALAAPQIRERALAAGTEPLTNTPDEFAAMIREETKKWAEVIKAGGIRLQ
ncbi:MAG TPA: tripartite tricarboxylate transporter substrate binding protein [Burkholderiales bacterium]|jgi:tripartite-type tricarboxylate transporter receptor subunit TctC|nr:tripartite tricarboxylate transporter substrate binding protein [Burkholderiales bacterium]